MINYFSSEAEKNKWLNDLKTAIENIKAGSEEHKNQYTSTLKSNGILNYQREFHIIKMFAYRFI